MCKSCCFFVFFFVKGYPRKKGVNPSYCYHCLRIKCLKDVSCVDHLSSVNLVTMPQLLLQIAPIFREVGSPRASLKVVTLLREGYTLLFRLRPNLTKSPTVISCYVNPHKNLYLLEALHQLWDKNAVEPVATQKSLGFYNRQFCTQMQQPVESYLGPEHLEHLLKHRVIQNGDIRDNSNPLQAGVTSIDFKDAYFHIPIHSQSRKYMRFHVQGRSYQFKALPFGLSTAPMEFTVVAKEVKLMALQRGIRIHQYLDALDPKQVFNFVGYQLNLKEGKVRPTPECWQALTTKIQTILSDLMCLV